MKGKNLRFFTPEENQPKAERREKSKQLPTGHITSTGKLVFPAATLSELGIEPENMHFQLGTDQGKRKIKALYLVPTGNEGAFNIVRTGRGYALPLDVILSKGGIDYASRKFIFTASIFLHEGSTAYALEISEEPQSEKAAYTGKPRGRKPASKNLEAS
ncbi:hypothetical protein ACN9ML_29310 [Dyadobacter endophyticus]|uniref:hypothetical protein n=1 Tax=Dyadobacter endophyticus TaxID=1749036 RepID=UPI003CEEFFEE